MASPGPRTASTAFNRLRQVSGKKSTRGVQTAKERQRQYRKRGQLARVASQSAGQRQQRRCDPIQKTAGETCGPAGRVAGDFGGRCRVERLRLDRAGAAAAGRSLLRGSAVSWSRSLLARLRLPGRIRGSRQRRARAGSGIRTAARVPAAGHVLCVFPAFRRKKRKDRACPTNLFRSGTSLSGTLKAGRTPAAVQFVLFDFANQSTAIHLQHARHLRLIAVTLLEDRLQKTALEIIDLLLKGRNRAAFVLRTRFARKGREIFVANALTRRLD